MVSPSVPTCGAEDAAAHAGHQEAAHTKDDEAPKTWQNAAIQELVSIVEGHAESVAHLGRQELNLRKAF